MAAEQIRFDFYEEERKGDFLNCELTCIHYETGEKCIDCVLAENYEGAYAEQIRASAAEQWRILEVVFGGSN